MKGVSHPDGFPARRDGQMRRLGWVRAGLGVLVALGTGLCGIGEVFRLRQGLRRDRAGFDKLTAGRLSANRAGLGEKGVISVFLVDLG